MNLELFRSFVADPAHAAIVMDFDGSLAEIVDHPDDARPLDGVVGMLHALVARFGRVAIVSGRPVSFLRAALPVDGLDLIGQYGLERAVGDEIVVDERALGYAEAIAAVADAAEAELGDVFVERKGSVAVTLHWRTCAERGRNAESWAHRAAAAHGLTEYPTKMAVELRPPVAVDKGSAVEQLCAGMDAALFAGDDHGDLSAFAALARLRSAGAIGHAVRIGVRSAEAPAELLETADVVVDGPVGLLELLTGLVRAVSARG